MKKVFEVELKRESYVVYTVEAESEDAAIDMAWRELEMDGSAGDSAHWGVESVEEIKE